MSLNSLKYPLKSDNLFETLAIGTIIIIASIFILPWFIIMGFYMKVIHHSSKGKEIPKFENYGKLFINGLKYFVVSLMYLLFVIINVLMFSILSEIGGIIGLIAVGIMTMIYLLYVYLIPAIMYEFAQEYKILDAFKFTKMSKYILSLKYIKITLLLSIIYPILFVLIQFGVAITIIGLLFIPATIIYEMMVYGHLVSKVGDIENN